VGYSPVEFSRNELYTWPVEEIAAETAAGNPTRIG
jgi:hypothetical protein